MARGRSTKLQGLHQIGEAHLFYHFRFVVDADPAVSADSRNFSMVHNDEYSLSLSQPGAPQAPSTHIHTHTLTPTHSSLKHSLAPPSYSPAFSSYSEALAMYWFVVDADPGRVRGLAQLLGGAQRRVLALALPAGCVTIP